LCPPQAVQARKRRCNAVGGFDGRAIPDGVIEMTAERFEELLTALNEREKFQPFTVELLAGHRFEVDHPRAMVVRDGVAVYLKPGGIPVWFDHEGVTQIAGDLLDRSS